MASLISETRRFDGKVYRKQGVFTRKSDILKEKTRFAKAGYRIRMARGLVSDKTLPGGRAMRYYVLYVRKE